MVCPQNPRATPLTCVVCPQNPGANDNEVLLMIPRAIQTLRAYYFKKQQEERRQQEQQYFRMLQQQRQNQIAYQSTYIAAPCGTGPI